MRKAGGIAVIAALAAAAAPAMARKAPDFIVGSAPVGAPRGYVDMCRTAGAPLCEEDQVTAPLVAERSGPSFFLSNADDATGSIGPAAFEMSATAPASVDLVSSGLVSSGPSAPCRTAPTLGNSLDSLDHDRADLSFERSALRVRVSASQPYDLAVISAPVALQAMSARPARQDDCNSGWRSGPIDPALRLSPFTPPAEPAAAREFPAPPTVEARWGDDKAAYAQLRRMNRFVNQRVRQRTDEQMYGRGEVWRRSGTGRGAQGDCEDLAIEKRLGLIARDFPPDRLFFAVVYRGDIGLHTILIARLADGDYVLDSLSPYVVVWSKAPYSWISVQAPGHPSKWFSIQPPGGQVTRA